MGVLKKHLEGQSAEAIGDDSPIAQTVNLIIERGIKTGASDIHIEPREGFIAIRFRIDGIMRAANKLPSKALPLLLLRIKSLANLQSAEHRAPQDGRFRIELAGEKIAVGVSILPIVDGEKIALRLIREISEAATLEELGFWGQARTTIQHASTQPSGLVLVTGPNDSGKSTTLFSTLSTLNTPNVNIATIEEIIEHRIVGANQTQISPIAGMTFASGLRALLHQDPNIIMVGEIRDTDTAQLAVQAAHNGHLVFSTLHTENAAHGISRLLNMGLEPYLVASTIRAVIGQRLVRRLCTQCRETFEPDAKTIKQLKKAFDIADNDDFKEIHALERVALADGIGKHTLATRDSLSSTSSTVHRLFEAHVGGCEMCHHSGYKGRIGIYEVLPGTDSLQKAIAISSSTKVLQQHAIKEGILTMQRDGFIKALRGVTTIEEVLRVTTGKEL